MVGVLRDRQKQLLRQLLRNKAGLGVDELSRNLVVTRTAVRQHLAALMRDGFVGPGAMRPSGGRPQQLYRLTDVGKEAFPRHYSWFAQLLIDAMAREHGAAGLRARLRRIASVVAAQLRNRFSETKNPRQRVQQLAARMWAVHRRSRQTTACSISSRCRTRRSATSISRCCRPLPAAASSFTSAWRKGATCAVSDSCVMHDWEQVVGLGSSKTSTRK